MGSLRLALCTGVLTAAAVTPTAHAAVGEGLAPAPSAAPVDAGATARTAADTTREDGPGPARTVTGPALVGAAAVAVVRDRVRRSSGTGRS